MIVLSANILVLFLPLSLNNYRTLVLCVGAFHLLTPNQKYDTCQFKGKHSKNMNYSLPMYLNCFDRIYSY